jgi:hypothetical protein
MFGKQASLTQPKDTETEGTLFLRPFVRSRLDLDGKMKYLVVYGKEYTLEYIL